MLSEIGRPYWVAARLALLGAAAFLAADTVSTLVRGRLRTTLPPSKTVAAASGPTLVARPLADYLALARRDLFAAPPASEPSVSDPTRRSPSSLRLLGTGRRGGERWAILEDPVAKRQDVLRVGEKIGDAEVVKIGFRRVVVRRGGQEEIVQTVVDAAAAPAAPTGTPATGASAASTGPSDEQIKALGDDRFLIAKSEVEHSLENLSDIFTQARAVPQMEGGKPNGFKLFAIRKDSLLEKIGLQNNDLIQRVNGIELGDPARAMSLLQELQGQTRLSVDVVRGGTPRTLTYEIR